ncbi:hypothetical protein BJ912DRAFT_1041708 [Pholiota molesta]|nr:hypothetical protein BJ912DRAFT_1041708 [Pholiota molesta]
MPTLVHTSQRTYRVRRSVGSSGAQKGYQTSVFSPRTGIVVSSWQEKAMLSSATGTSNTSRHRSRRKGGQKLISQPLPMTGWHYFWPDNVGQIGCKNRKLRYESMGRRSQATFKGLAVGIMLSHISSTPFGNAASYRCHSAALNNATLQGTKIEYLSNWSSWVVDSCLNTSNQLIERCLMRTVMHPEDHDVDKNITGTPFALLRTTSAVILRDI